MVDNLKPADRKKTMQAVKGKGTRLEIRLFATLAGMKLRGWKKNAHDVIGKPDVVFPHERLAIFIDGCFWHGCPVCNRKLPLTNQEYWTRKINRNIELAQLHGEKLADEGWIVIRVWEHELKDREAMRKIKFAVRKALNKEHSQ